jgi:uncharacterized membrane protein YozB (DUF420 family)
MTGYFDGHGFLDTRGTIGADVSLLVMIVAAVMLTTGVVLARTRHYRAHRWVQTAAVCLNAVPVAFWMIRSYWLYVRPGLPGVLSKGRDLLATVHALTGVAGVALGVFIVIRANQLEARGESVSRYKTTMRVAYVVYMLAVALGIWLYVVTYG